MKTLKLSILILPFALMSFAPKQEPFVSKNNGLVTFNVSSVKWEKDLIDLGEIPQSKPVTVDFEFKNISKSPVTITEAHASCGCTTASFEKTPILPGKSTKISTTYNAANKGSFKKTVTVTISGEESPKVLTITGTVI